MSTPNQDEQMIAKYLFTKLPRSLSAAYKTLASLTYPINDKQSLTVQLDALERPNQDSAKTDVSAADLIRGSFSVFDFPIETPQSALEKFDARVLEPRGGDFPSPDFGKVVETLPPFKTLGPSCAAFATRVYLDRLIAHEPEISARWAAERDGQKCQDNIGFVAGPCFDVALRAYLEARGSGSFDFQAWAAAHQVAIGCSDFPVPHLPHPIPSSA
jgi:hypothetical protein